MSYLGVGVSPGNVAVYHGTNMKLIDRRVRLTQLILRFAVCAFALLATLLVAMDTQVKEIFSIPKKAKFTDMKALVFLVTANGVAAAYSLLQAIRCLVKGNVLLNKPLAWVIFSGDQAIAYLCVASVAAAAQAAAIAKLGEEELEWMKICNMYGKFCNQIGEGIGSALFASIAMVMVSCISAFSLFRLYGGTKAPQSSLW